MLTLVSILYAITSVGKLGEIICELLTYNLLAEGVCNLLCGCCTSCSSLLVASGSYSVRSGAACLCNIYVKLPIINFVTFGYETKTLQSSNIDSYTML